MTASEIFEKATPQCTANIISFLHDEDRTAYRSVMTYLTSRRKLRPVFLEKKPKLERHQWMVTALGNKRNEDLALEILQTWVLKTQSEAILQFLEDLGIEHDGKGLIETTPPEPAPDLVEKGVTHLLEKYPAEHIAIYLHLFLQMDPEGWIHLRKLLAELPALQIPPLPTSLS